MKYIITILFISLCVTSLAQSRDVNIHDNGKTLKLIYKNNTGDKQINYENYFDVSGWSQQQKDRHIRQIIDSLNNSPAKTEMKLPDYEAIKISEVGDRLTLTVDYKSASQNIKFSNTYDVKGKSKEEKEAMVKKILEGLGIKK